MLNDLINCQNIYDVRDGIRFQLYWKQHLEMWHVIYNDGTTIRSWERGLLKFYFLFKKHIFISI